MAPTIPIDYTGQRESKKLSKSGFGDMMGKTRKVSKGFSTGFVPDYRHAVETVAESDGLGSSGRVDMELAGSQDSFPRNRKSISLSTDGYERSNVPIQVLQLSKMSPLERRDLNVRLKIELDQVRKLQRKIDSFSFDSINDVHNYQNGPKRPAMVESLPLSTNDVPMAPGKKKIPTGRNGPRTKGGTVASRRNEPVRQQSFARSTNSAILMKQCETLLTRLMSHQHAWIFNEPVDVVKHNIPDYFTVIKHPMDLGTIKSKLLSNQYSGPLEFAADVRLTFKNALTYNPPKHDVHTMAEIMNKFFEVRWKPIQKKIPVVADESTPSKSSIVTEPESGYVQPPAKKQKTFTEKTIIMENKVQREIDKPTMSNEEKEKLGLDLQELMEELPDNILNFLKENTLNSSEVSEDEIEIDIDALSDDTLFTLRKLLNAYLLEKQQKQAIIEPCENELQKESGFSNLSVEPCKDNEATDEDVDIGGNEPPLVAGSTPMKIDNDALRRNSNCSSSRSSSSESDSSSTDSESSPDEVDGAKNSVPETVGTEVEQMKRGPGDPSSRDSDGHAEQNLLSNSSTMEPNCRQEGESAPPDRQVSPGKLYRAAVLRSRFADIIIKAQENTNEKGDPEKLKLEKEELERRRKEEKARLQAEAKAAEEARKKAEAEAAAEARKKRELEREAARQALQQMEKTVDINENSHFMEDLEMFKSAPDEPLQNLLEEASPESSHNGLGSFKFQGSNALEQLGLYMKNDEEEEEEIEPQSVLDTSNDPEEGEID